MPDGPPGTDRLDAVAEHEHCTVDVQCFDSVARVVGLLRGRRYEVVRMQVTRPAIAARSSNESPPWRVELTVERAEASDDDLLLHRLERLVGVLGVRRA